MIHPCLYCYFSGGSRIRPCESEMRVPNTNEAKMDAKTAESHDVAGAAEGAQGQAIVRSRQLSI